MRVLAAMSGGVDSAVAAARAVAAGHEVIGVHLALSRDPQSVRESSRGCCSLEDSADARRVCDKLGIPFYVWDFSDRFQADVIDDFVDSYARGETPNPCLRCNEKIKFEALLERGIALGFDAVVTGHYAQLTQVADGGDGYLRRGIDPEKDQSYVLGVLGAHEIAHCMFPVGDTLKPEIRKEAAEMGFSVATKPDSYDICFIPDGNTQAFLGKRIGLRPGMIVDTKGTVLKEHDGAWNYTIGQRKGLDIKQPAADGRPRYVTDIDAASGTVTVGSREDLDVHRIEADRLKYLHPAMQASFAAEVQVRAHGEAVPCQVTVDQASDRMEIVLATPLYGVARGQAAVIYLPDAAGDIVAGSGTIIGTA
ncbi:tRNA 2-thiouridine(34) synthase MnmA [Corynebacterium sp. HS2168-gen11]|uniref:tRNA 2-thiouridine(34) synthase MnmA n=1 Tax=Corynebacterium sp. HS2168-gen11 TaxID=2974027 RepID=UPI00216B4903|nr:tRNA 2-thiouridine(34) synthase MnmA [Corynebacterium sp. HS2168-gen11]MCS4534847.1 tRNA 2-thiouridine(34) synthase MnmA [Corynebacterium sp. HS2168-gen11]